MELEKPRLYLSINELRDFENAKGENWKTSENPKITWGTGELLIIMELIELSTTDALRIHIPFKFYEFSRTI